MNKGRCGCGKITYTVEGKPIEQAFCYCTECQKYTGSDKFFGAWYARDQFKIISGKPSLFTRTGASGKNINIMFCSTCGVKIGADVESADFYSISVNSLDDNTAFAPTMAIFAASAPRWANFPEGIPRFDILPPELEHLLA
jgi:hypothetical protein